MVFRLVFSWIWLCVCLVFVCIPVHFLQREKVWRQLGEDVGKLGGVGEGTLDRNVSYDKN